MSKLHELKPFPENAPLRHVAIVLENDSTDDQAMDAEVKYSNQHSWGGTPRSPWDALRGAVASRNHTYKVIGGRESVTAAGIYNLYCVECNEEIQVLVKAIPYHVEDICVTNNKGEKKCH